MSAALADGFVESGGCEATPHGAEGIEHVNLARATDRSVDVERPEALLYVPEGLGGFGRRLVAVQYSVPVLDESQEPPELFGRRFRGPVAGTIPGLEHYRLRVWLFSEGPQGVFAEAHPAEACDSGGPVAPHSTFIGCQEVGVSLFFPAARVREIAKIPDDFRLEGEDDEGGGTTGVTAAGFSCDRVILEDGTEVSDLRFAEVWANVQAPDWEGVGNNGASRYLLRMTFNDLGFARSLRRGMGVGSGVLGHSPDVAREFDSIVGLTGDYAFSSPEFTIRATVTEPVAHGRPVFVRIWREGRRGMGTFHAWVGNVAFGAAVGEVIPTPGTLLAELVGCDSDADACDPILTGGFHVTFDPAPYTTTVLQEMWNPRHNGTT